VGPLVTHASELTRQVANGPARARRSNGEIIDQVESSRQWLIARSDEVNGLDALTWGPIALPSVSGLPGASNDVAFVNGWLDGLGLLGACLGVSLLLGAWFYAGLAAASTATRGGALAVGRTMPRAVVDVLGLVAVLAGG